MKKTIYLASVLISIILGIIIHSGQALALSTESVIRFYFGLFVIMIPNLFFLYFVRDKIKTEKLYQGYFLGYCLGVFIIIIFAILRVLDPSDVTFGLNSILYWLLVFLPTLIMGLGFWLSLKNRLFLLSENLGVIIMMLAFTLFMISTMKGFYIRGGNVLAFSGRFLHIGTFFDYAFTGSIVYALTYLSFIASTFFKYRTLESIE